MTGAQLWQSVYTTARGTDDVVSAIHVLPDGAPVYATGFSGNGPADFDMLTLRYSGATPFQIDWAAFYDAATMNDAAAALWAQPGGLGDVFVTGFGTFGGAAGEDMVTVRYRQQP